MAAQTPTGFMSVKSAPFSAAGDGVTNDYNAFQMAFNSSQPIYVPAGSYIINNSAGPLIANNFSQSLTFSSAAIIICTTVNQGCLGFIGGSNANFSGIHITYQSVPTDDCRVPNGMCSTLFIMGMTNPTVDGTTIDNGWAIAFSFINNISGSVTHTSVNHSTRDGLYLQDNQAIVVSSLRVLDSGDDCLGFHDTTSGGGRHGAMATNITCINIRGGGIAVAGASNVSVSNFVVNGTSAPGIYIMSDPTQGFLKPTDVIISNGAILNVGSVPDAVSRTGTQHGIMMYGSASNTVGALTFQSIVMSGINGSGIMGGGFVDSVSLTNIGITNSGLDGAISNSSCISFTGQTSISATGITVQGCYRAGFLAVSNSSVIVRGLSVTNAWNKGSAEPGAEAVCLLANTFINIDATIIIDDRPTPTGYAFSEWQDGSGSVTNLTSQIENGSFQLLGGSPGVRIAFYQP
jgi:hypothetical protein